MPYVHPQVDRIEGHTAWDLGCAVDALRSPGTTTVTAQPKKLPWLDKPVGAIRSDFVRIFRCGYTSILRVNPEPTPEVQRALAALPGNTAIKTEHFLAIPELSVRPYIPDSIFYLDPQRFHAVPNQDIRPLNGDDRAVMDNLHSAIDPKQRWFVDLHHPFVVGCFVDEQLVAVASHFLFDDHRIAEAGVLTHPTCRRRGYGKAVVSAAVRWGLDRDWVIKWSTCDSNMASVRLTESLGFVRFAQETDLRISAT